MSCEVQVPIYRFLRGLYRPSSGVFGEVPKLSATVPRYHYFDVILHANFELTLIKSFLVHPRIQRRLTLCNYEIHRLRLPRAINFSGVIQDFYQKPFERLLLCSSFLSHCKIIFQLQITEFLKFYSHSWFPIFTNKASAFIFLNNRMNSKQCMRTFLLPKKVHQDLGGCIILDWHIKIL